MVHSFHIPVLGLGYSIDTPLKVARFGISSVVSIVDDELTERMRKYHAQKEGLPYQLIEKTEYDSRAKRIEAYLNLLDTLVSRQMATLKEMSFEEENDLCRYFEYLPEGHPLKNMYHRMRRLPRCSERYFLQVELKRKMVAGRIDVNIMSKVDKANYDKGRYLGDEFTDALSAMRGFALSNLRSAVVISAGLNPRLFSYMERLDPFFKYEQNDFVKKIFLKVSDYRSALVQAKILAKKGLWVSEFRIESGLNCGGHAFATEGLLLGPILQEFKENSEVMHAELYAMWTAATRQKNISIPQGFKPEQRITVQGGIGNASEQQFLVDHYQTDGTGWGSPFLLVPEATNVDQQTLQDLTTASVGDFYISNASPLGVPFNNFRKSSSERLRLDRIAKGQPGSPCTKKYLCSNTEFTSTAICTASKKYQGLKIKQLQSAGLPKAELNAQIAAVTEKVCLCEGLCASAYEANHLLRPRESKAVSICPGPNLAYFNRPYQLKEMIEHIYGKQDLLKGISRPNLFVKEFTLYVDYLRNLLDTPAEISIKRSKYLNKFYEQLGQGFHYYKELILKSDSKNQIWCEEQIEALKSCYATLISMASRILPQPA